MTRLVNLLGADLGKKILQPQIGVNDEGFWENSEIVDANEGILKYLSSAWYDPRPFSYHAELSKEIRENLRKVVDQEFAGKQIIAIKDPRLCRLLPYWLDLIQVDELGWAPQFITILRDPMEVVLSLQKRDGLPITTGFWLWVDHVLASERFSRGYPRRFFSYDKVLSDVDSVVQDVFSFVVQNEGGSAEDRLKQIRAEINPKHRHYQTNQWVPLDPVQEIAHHLYRRLSMYDEKQTDYLDEVWSAFHKIAEDNQLGLKAAYDANCAYFSVKQELMRVGGDLFKTHQVIEERDTQLQDLQALLSSLGRQHEYAIGVVKQRDEQISELQLAHEALGKEHAYAISTVEARDITIREQNVIIEQRDRVIQDLSSKIHELYSHPIVGRLCNVLRIK